jgi:hypothetical protein
MDVAFEMTLGALGLLERPDQLNEIVAQRIFEVAKQGERNPDRLCERVLKSLHEQYLVLGRAPGASGQSRRVSDGDTPAAARRGVCKDLVPNTTSKWPDIRD